MVTKLVSMVANLEQPLHKMLLYTLVTWSCEITWKTKNICTTPVLMATKLGRIVTKLQKLLPIMLLYPLVAWFCEITWQAKTIISPLPQCLWSPKLSRWWLTLSSFYPKCYSTLWARSLARSRDILKTSSLRLCQTYREGVPPIKSYDPWITWCCEITWQTKTSTTTTPMATKFGSIVT